MPNGNVLPALEISMQVAQHTDLDQFYLVVLAIN